MELFHHLNRLSKNDMFKNWVSCIYLLVLLFAFLLIIYIIIIFILVGTLAKPPIDIQLMSFITYVEICLWLYLSTSKKFIHRFIKGDSSAFSNYDFDTLTHSIINWVYVAMLVVAEICYCFFYDSDFSKYFAPKILLTAYVTYTALDKATRHTQR